MKALEPSSPHYAEFVESMINCAGGIYDGPIYSVPSPSVLMSPSNSSSIPLIYTMQEIDVGSPHYIEYMESIINCAGGVYDGPVSKPAKRKQSIDVNSPHYAEWVESVINCSGGVYDGPCSNSPIIYSRQDRSSVHDCYKIASTIAASTTAAVIADVLAKFTVQKIIASTLYLIRTTTGEEYSNINKLESEI